MKLLLSLAALAAVIGLSSCGSKTSENNLSSEERAQQLKTDPNLPAQARQRVDEQLEAKKQMDAMRAKEAAQAPKTP